jgi:hypothetical protein
MPNLRLATGLLWSIRILVGCMPFVGAGVGAPLETRSTAIQIVGTVLAWLVWGLIVLASFISHPISLTVLRMGTPVVAGFLVFIAATDQGSTLQIINAAISFAVFLLSFSAEIGSIYIQASAYGDERRFLLRPPVAFVAPVAISVVIVNFFIIATPMFFAARIWLAGVISLIGLAACIKFMAPRIHQLSRRWLVFVPAGFVVHDEIVLSINLMIKKQELVDIQLARDDTQAADLSALTWGVPLELSFNKTLDVSLTAIGARHLKAVSAIHATSIIIAPSRPGAVLRAY